MSKFPGPPLLASTNFPLQYLANVSGTWFKTVKKAHEKYGPVVRIGPNHLALDGVVGWPQAYGIRKAGEKEFPKYPDYFEGGNANILCSDRESHRKLRKGMSGGFSEANLSEQALTIEHYIGLLVDLVTRRTKEGKDVDIVKMLNFTTFDIIGDLTYNDDFNSLQGDSDGGHHSWVLGLIEGVKGNAARRFGKFYPIFNPIVSWLWGSEIALTNEQNQMAGAKAFKRMEKGVIPPDGHKDFMTHMMKTAGGPAESALSPLEMMMNCSVIVMAGSETVATAMSGFFFYLHQNPRVYKILTKEIREAYKDESEIDMKNASALPYLHAVIEETMRVYPPAVEVSPRASPGAEVNGTWVPEGVRIFPLVLPYIYVCVCVCVCATANVSMIDRYICFPIFNLPQPRPLPRPELLPPRALAACLAPSARPRI